MYRWWLETEVSRRQGTAEASEVHGAVGQVVLAADVADLLGLHSLEFGAVRSMILYDPKREDGILRHHKYLMSLQFC